MNRVRSLLLGLLFVLGCTASAQLPPGFKMPSLWYNPALMMDPGVQKDLHASPAAVQKIQSAIMTQGMKMMPLMGSSMGGKAPTAAEQQKMMPVFLAAFDAMQKACVDNLSKPQLERLHQITLQSFGPKSLLDPKVGSQVGLTASQKTTLTQALAKVTAAQQQAAMKMMRNSTGNQGAAMGLLKQTRKQTDAVLNAILTPKQKQKWAALQGKPIELSGMAGMMGGG